MKLISPDWWRAPLRHGASRQWHALADALRRGKRLDDLQLRDEASLLGQDIAAFLQLSDPRAQRARAALGSMVMPAGTDWRWRPPMLCGPISPAAIVGPENGRHLGGEVALWHDCAQHALLLRQVQNRRATDLAAFGLRLEVMGCTGNYMSLSVEMPSEATEGLGRDHILRLETVLQAERPITVYGRLNLSQGPNTAQILRRLGHPIDTEPAHRVVEFDLAYADLALRPVERVWLDLIFEAPRMNAMDLTDIVLSRHPRAQI